MQNEKLPAHSPLGGSSAERWMNCPGSTRLIRELGLDHSAEPDYQREGTAAHEVGALCLTSKMDAWEFVGVARDNGVILDVEAIEAIQVFLDVCAPAIERAMHWGVEERVTSPLHPLYYGTVDFWAWFEESLTLEITDYKHGEGIVVEVEENPQVMYYGYGLIRKYPSAKIIRFRIVQPRIKHSDSPVRTWECSSEHLRRWAETVLVPAMYRAELDDDLDPGKWCRFCPAKLVCPMQRALFGAASQCDPADVVQMTDDDLGRNYALAAVVRMYLKALEEQVLTRRLCGAEVPGTKLVNKRADRVFKPGAEEVLKVRLGDAIYTAPELKSPAQIDKLDGGKKLTATWAYTPHTGYTIATTDDKRPAVQPPAPASEVFAGAVENLVGDTTLS